MIEYKAAAGIYSGIVVRRRGKGLFLLSPTTPVPLGLPGGHEHTLRSTKRTIARPRSHSRRSRRAESANAQSRRRLNENSTTGGRRMSIRRKAPWTRPAEAMIGTRPAFKQRSKYGRAVSGGRSAWERNGSSRCRNNAECPSLEGCPFSGVVLAGDFGTKRTESGLMIASCAPMQTCGPSASSAVAPRRPLPRCTAPATGSSPSSSPTIAFSQNPGATLIGRD